MANPGRRGAALSMMKAVSPNMLTVMRLLAAATGISSMVRGMAPGGVAVGSAPTAGAWPALGAVTSAGSNV